jgi:F-type H+-transporting ATPase subunit b
MILIFANPFWNHVIAQAPPESSHADRLVHRRRAGAQLRHPGVVDEALSLQAHPQRHRRAREAHRHGARDADAKKAEAQRSATSSSTRTRSFDQQRAALLRTDEAKTERQRLLDEARRAADLLSAKRQESLKEEAINLNQAITRRARQEVFAIARKALADLATTSLEERMGEVFTRRLREMDARAKATLGQALKSASERALVRSAFDLPPEQRAAIQNALNETFSANLALRFEVAADLVSGIELSANGQKVAWSITDYLASLERSVGDLLEEKAKSQVQAEPKPQPKAEPKPEPKAEPKPGAKVEPKLEPDGKGP